MNNYEHVWTDSIYGKHYVTRLLFHFCIFKRMGGHKLCAVKSTVS